MAVVLKNNVVGYLAYAFNAGDTVLRLRTNDGLKFPFLDAPDYFYATLSSATQSDIMEIVKVTYRMNDNLSVVRAQEDTVELSFPIGTKVELRVTAKSIKDAIGEVDVTSNVEAAQAAAQAAALSAAEADASADAAAGSAGSASTYAGQASTSAGNAAGSSSSASTFAGQASTSAGNAAGSASAANISSGTAAGSASAAAGSASAAAGSAGSASTFASNASTSAGQASQSQSAASGSASSANISATAAAASSFNASGDATNAGISASAASTSASNAATSASAAGVSATASQTSSVSAQSVANRLLPERVSVAADFLAGTAHTAPDTATPTTLGTVVTVAGEGDVREFVNTVTGVVTRGGLPVSSGRTFRLTARMRLTVDGAACYFRTAFNVYDSSWTHLGNVSLTDHDLAFTVADGWQTYSHETTSAIILAAFPTAVYVRGRVLQFSAANNTWQVAFLRLQDVTSESSAAGSATAAATSASNASTSAGQASGFATAASGSATTASTEAGNAATSAQNASTSESNASGHAGTASTQAGLASTSAVSAQTVANNLVPNRPSVAADYTNSLGTGDPSTIGAFTGGTVVAVAGEGDVRQVTTTTTIQTRGWLPVVAGATYRRRYRSRVLVEGTSNVLRAGINIYSQTGTSLGFITFNTDDPAHVFADGWVTFDTETTAAAILAAQPTAAYVRAFGIFAGKSDNSASGATVQVAILEIANITSLAAAAGSATAAAASATTASTKAGEASNSATAASSSSLAAKSTAIAQGIGASDFSADGLFWTNTFGGAASAAADPIGTYANISEEGRVLQSTVSGTGTVGYYLTQKYALTPRAGRKYKLTARIRVTADATGGGVLSSNFHVNGLNTTLVHGNPTFTGTAVAGFNTSINPINVASGWQNISIIYMLGTPGSFDVFWRPRIDFIRTGAGSTGGSFETAFFRIEDVTDSEAATLAASAAATSSSNASTSAGQASGFATAASGSATTASTQAGNAATSAGQASTSAGNAATSESNASTSAGNAAGSASTASTQASNASGFATQASSSATLSATFASGSQGSINSSATFADNLNATGVPTNWIDWANATGAGTRVTGIAPQPYAFRLSSGAGASAGIRQILSGRISTGWHVLEADITLNSGALTGAGLLLNADPASAYTEYLLNFSTDKDTNGSVIGAGTAGTLYKFRKLVQSAVGVTQSSIYAMSHYTSFGSIASANDITWHRCAVRVASQAEIEARAATNDVVGLTSSVATNASAIATVNGAAAFWETIVSAGGGDLSAVRLKAGSTGSYIELISTVLRLANVSNGAVIEVMRAISGEAFFSRPISSDSASRRLTIGPGYGVSSSEVVLWFGPVATAPSSQSRTNGYFALGTDGKVYYGSAELVGGTAPMTATITGDFLDNTRTTAKTPTIDVSPAISGITNGTSPYTYSWSLVEMRDGTAPTLTNATTSSCTLYRAATLANNASYDGTWQCLITDANGKICIKYYKYSDFSAL